MRDNVSLRIPSGGRVAVIGPDGAGKSTLIGAITGNVALSSGSVVFRGKRLGRMQPHRRARHGLGRTFRHVALFESMTVRENLEDALDSEVGDIGRARPRRDRAMETLSVFGLGDLAGRAVRTPPYRQKKVAEQARCLVRRPAVALLDEPAAGLDISEKEQFVGSLDEAARPGRGFGAADRARHADRRGAGRGCVLLNAGKVIAHGDFDTVTSDDAVIRAYLGDR